MPAIKKPISFPEHIHAQLLDRSAASKNNLSGQVQIDLTTYWAALDHGLATVRQKLTWAEAQHVLGALSGTPVFVLGTPISIWIKGGLHYHVASGIDQHNPGKKWKVNILELTNKIEALSGLETLALLDWCSQMWAKYEDTRAWNKGLAQFKKSP